MTLSQRKIRRLHRGRVTTIGVPPELHKILKEMAKEEDEPVYKVIIRLLPKNKRRKLHAKGEEYV